MTTAEALDRLRGMREHSQSNPFSYYFSARDAEALKLAVEIMERLEARYGRKEPHGGVE